MSQAQHRPVATVHIAQGEQAVGRDPEMVVGTILGSCVAACIWDPKAGVGGMNHVLLPDCTPMGVAIDGLGASAMERLINALLREGASRGNLRAKAFGGARMMAGLPDIGRRNIEFVTGYLLRESIPIEGSSFGGNQARMIRFWPVGGRVRQRLVDRVEEQVAPPRVPVGNDVELF